MRKTINNSARDSTRACDCDFSNLTESQFYSFKSFQKWWNNFVSGVYTKAWESSKRERDRMSWGRFVGNHGVVSDWLRVREKELIAEETAWKDGACQRKREAWTKWESRRLYEQEAEVDAHMEGVLLLYVKNYDRARQFWLKRRVVEAEKSCSMFNLLAMLRS
jgi:hypothetical protein